ncbi:hypothetical protein V1512DRAFT_207490 [Lipomyces arxii]|uniref:uncharacterized protein n=1 Tax=Lipomyces arxii TaxID=56418 RepID=UPI0034CD4C2D
MQQDQTVLIPHDSSLKKKTFKFDKSYWSFDSESDHFAGQDQVFKDLGLPLLDNAFKGFNNCIFAYGQTGSGKSYSMIGSRDEPGVIPRICQQLFNRISQNGSGENMQCTVEVSYLEIYNERVRDLLNPKNKGNLRVREHPSLGPYVEDLSRLIVRSFEEIEALMDEGNKARTVAATNMNETSSRSHAVFTLTLTQKWHDDETNMDAEKMSRISLVDLAGSERASATGATGSRLKEGAEINKSLTTLGRVIRSLADLALGKAVTVIPYRDSVLTWLLKDSLGGNSMTAMMATISPADINYEETASTLRYADSAKRIKNHAVVNEDPSAKLIRELKAELAVLHAKLESNGDTESAPATDLVSFTAPDGTVRKVTRAEIAEQLQYSEKLLLEVNQTWEERLAMTREIQKQRESALEELGINIEKDFVGLHTPKTSPYLVNLSDDPLLAECLVYNIKPGSTKVGNADSSTTAQIRLHGSKIQTDHCTFDNDDGVVTISPNEKAAVMVNGVRLKDPRRLHSGDRVILGDFHIFRFNHPQEALQARRSSTTVPPAKHKVERRHTHEESVVLRRSDSQDTTGKDSATSDYVDFPSFEEVSVRSVTPALPESEEDRVVGDWSFARMEAARTYLGSDPSANISALTDEELDKLFDEMQKIRSSRKNRPESSMSYYDDGESVISTSPLASRGRKLYNDSVSESEDPFVLHMNGSQTFDHSRSDSLKSKVNDLRGRLDGQRIDFESKLRESMTLLPSMSHTSTTDLDSFDEIRSRMSLKSPPPFVMKRKPELNQDEKLIAQKVFAIWSQQGTLRMMDDIYRHAVLLKEAQVMSIEMDIGLKFQFTVVDDGFVSASSYDLVLNNSEPQEDLALTRALKPCIAVRVMDFANAVIRIISLEMLEYRVRALRNIYNESPMYSELHGLEIMNPFADPFVQQYSYIGDAYVPMIGVLDGHKTEFQCDIISPHTLSVIGLVNIALEPGRDDEQDDKSNTRAIVAHLKSISGFSEREFTEVHVQIFLPEGQTYPGGVSTSDRVSGFGDSALVFDSRHAISIGTHFYHPMMYRGIHSTLLQLKIFARVSATHLEMLQSWDDIQEDSAAFLQEPQNADKPSLTAHHDAFVKLEVLELSDAGVYEPVDIMRAYNDDKGLLCLHIGVQKRIRLSITHSSGDSFDWSDISRISVSDVRLIDPKGGLHEPQSKVDKVELRLIAKPKTIANADGTRTVTAVGQWDSSAHSSVFLDRTTTDKYKIVMSVSWQIAAPSITSPVEFTTNLVGIMQGRSARAPSRLSLMLASSRIVHSYVALFHVQLRPYNAAAPSPLDVSNSYINGEEVLGSWKPRGVSLVSQYNYAHLAQIRRAELDQSKTVLSYTEVTDVESSDEPYTEEQTELLRKSINLWRGIDRRGSTSTASLLFMGKSPSTPKFVADVRQVQKSSVIVKEGYTEMPDDAMQSWQKRYLEFRRPYLHVYSLPEMQEMMAINVTNCRLGIHPEILDSLQRPHVFAIYANSGTHLVSVKSATELGKWVLKLGQSFSEQTMEEQH